ncbi:uncharacterized protein [Palaemon carinicauda]|uniref:uncharacterized protein n=1 Tax=Palaemon carinicauda TaxID=392227 RepID=UPI0035B60B1F
MTEETNPNNRTLRSIFTVEHNHALLKRCSLYFKKSPQPTQPVRHDGVEAPWGARCLVQIGSVLGHVPFCRPWHPDPPPFTWFSFKALYSVTLDILLTVVAIVELVDLLIHSGNYTVGRWIAHVWPEVVLQLAHLSLVIVTLPAAPLLAKLLRKINRLHHPSGPLASWVTFTLWVLNSLAVIVKVTLYFEIKGKGVFHSVKGFIYYLSNIYSRIYMTWPLAFVMQVCLSVRSCLRSSRELVQELADTSTGEKVDCFHLEDVRLWHRHLAEYNHTLVEIASPVILIIAGEVFFSFTPHLYQYIVSSLLAGELVQGNALAIAELLYMVTLFGVFLALVFVISAVVDEYHSIKLPLLEFPTYEAPRLATDQLTAFNSQLLFHDPAYTALGFFVVTKTNLLKLMGFIVVYMFILVPFHLGVHGDRGIFEQSMNDTMPYFHAAM